MQVALNLHYSSVQLQYHIIPGLLAKALMSSVKCSAVQCSAGQSIPPTRSPVVSSTLRRCISHLIPYWERETGVRTAFIYQQNCFTLIPLYSTRLCIARLLPCWG